MSQTQYAQGACAREKTARRGPSCLSLYLTFGMPSDLTSHGPQSDTHAHPIAFTRPCSCTVCDAHDTKRIVSLSTPPRRSRRSRRLRLVRKPRRGSQIPTAPHLDREESLRSSAHVMDLPSTIVRNRDHAPCGRANIRGRGRAPPHSSRAAERRRRRLRHARPRATDGDERDASERDMMGSHLLRVHTRSRAEAQRVADLGLPVQRRAEHLGAWTSTPQGWSPLIVPYSEPTSPSMGHSDYA